jgi:hypothetical protein
LVWLNWSTVPPRAAEFQSNRPRHARRGNPRRPGRVEL